MIVLNLTSAFNSKAAPVTLFLANNFSVSKPIDSSYRLAGACVNDGVHNNGGWYVQETYEEVIEMINAQIKK